MVWYYVFERKVIQMTKELNTLKELLEEIELYHSDILYVPNVDPEYIQGFYDCQKAIIAFYIRKLEEELERIREVR